MVDEPIIKAASHRSTNDLIFTLITDRISPASRILDFGAGPGHMCQRIGRHFENLNKDPGEHLVACEVVPEIFQYSILPSGSELSFTIENWFFLILLIVSK